MSSEEIVYLQGSISSQLVDQVAQLLSKNSYGQYLTKILHELGIGSQPLSLSTKAKS